MKNKLDIFETALKAISEMPGNELNEASAVAIRALEEAYAGAVDHSAAKLLEVKSTVVKLGVMFDTAPEISDALNKAGVTTVRGKEWSKSTVARIMPEVRDLIKADIANASPAASSRAPVEPGIANPVSEPAPTTVIESLMDFDDADLEKPVSFAPEADILAELEGL